MESYSENTINRPIILWGGTLYGEIAYKVIEKIYKRGIVAIIDNKIQVCGMEDKDGLKTIRSERLKEYYNCDVIICAATSYKQIAAESKKYVTNDLKFYDCKKILRDYQKAILDGLIDSKSNYLYGTQNLQQIIEKYDYYTGVQNGYDEKIYLSYCVLCITTKCSLRCKNCAAFVTKYIHQKDYTYSYIKTVFNKFLESIDGIQELELMGGEPFLCRDFNLILEWCISQDKIHAVKIITNGTILPKDKIWPLLAHDKIKLVIDDYGELSTKKEDIINVAKSYGVRYEEQLLQTWYALEPIKKKNYTRDQIEKKFHNCVFRNCIGVTNGRLYHCNVAGHMNTAGLLRDDMSQYIDIGNHKGTVKELKKMIKDYIAIPYLEACSYCNYSKDVEVKVAEQI